MVNLFSSRNPNKKVSKTSPTQYDPYAALGASLGDMRPLGEVELDGYLEIAKAAEDSLKHTKRGLDAIGRIDAVVTQTQSLYQDAAANHNEQVSSRTICSNLTQQRLKGIKRLQRERIARNKRVTAHKSLYGF